MNKDRIGVLLTRAQPFHNGHIETVLKALSECKAVYIIIGSSNKSYTTRNPFPLNLRSNIVMESLNSNGLECANIRVANLADWSTESSYEYVKEWGKFFYYNVVNFIRRKEFNFYYNDDINIAKNWFDDELLSRINIVNSPRISDISSTKIREAIIRDTEEDRLYLEKALSKRVRDFYIEPMRKILSTETLLFDTIMK